MKKNVHPLLMLLLPLLIVTTTSAQSRHQIHFPDLSGYRTLVCDLHMHTVFSDGQVWPSVRVQEAWRQGLDAISVTDHIEYQPHEEDVPTKHNRPYQLAVGPARELDILLLKGTEITRDTPPGHFNAIFVTEIDELDTEDLLEVMKRANEQGAFVFWNHQGWKGSEKGRWMEIHTTLYENGWLHGMEVCNGQSYYPDAHAWCLEKNLTMLGNTDMHGPDLREKSAPDNHRTLTLILAEERTPESIKEALVERRTMVWFEDQIIGRKELLEPLLGACVRVHDPHLRSKNAVWVKVDNACDLDIRLERTGDLGPENIRLPARTTSLVRINTRRPADPLPLRYTAVNFVIAPETGLPVEYTIPGK